MTVMGANLPRCLGTGNVLLEALSTPPLLTDMKRSEYGPYLILAKPLALFMALENNRRHRRDLFQHHQSYREPPPLDGSPLHTS